jgi:dihydrofolate reductase
MRKLIVNENLSLDGVMQGVGGPDEDRSGGFEHGGWPTPYFDDLMGKEASEGMQSTGAVLLGRRTYQIFAASWPYQPADDPFAGFLNSVPKYVVSTTLEEPLDWANASLILGDPVEGVRALKDGPGKDILILGSGQLAQTLMAVGLVDEYQLWIYPITLGSGKRLFTGGSPKIPLRLVSNKTSGSGVLLLTYRPEP